MGYSVIDQDYMSAWGGVYVNRCYCASFSFFINVKKKYLVSENRIVIEMHYWQICDSPDVKFLQE